MLLTCNSSRQGTSACLRPGPTVVVSAKRDMAGLSISPEQSKPRRADRIALVTLLTLGLGFLAAASLFAAALISLIPD